MGLFSQNVRKFTTAESFRLYMEGLRSLQMYEEMASESSIDRPASRKALEDRLDDAARNLSECVGKYQKDLLPLYYYAILLSTQAQRVEAVQLQDYLADSDMPPWPSERAEQLYKESATEFRNAVAKSHGEVKRFAQYNLAQVRAKIMNPAGWEDALELLCRLRQEDSRLKALLSLEFFFSVFRWMLSQIQFLLRSIGSDDGTTGQAASAATSAAERNAFETQVQMLIGFIQVRQAARDHSLSMACFPVPPMSGPDLSPTPSEASKQRLLDFQTSRKASNQKVETHQGHPHRNGVEASQDLLSLIDTLGERGLPSQARSDLAADYWNKWSRIALECAVLPGRSEQETSKLIDLASDYAQTSSQLKKSTWTPALLNRAFARTLAEGDAQKLLTAIVGRDVVVEAKPTPKTPDPDEIAKYILAMPLGTPSATIANLVRRAFGPLDAPTLQELVRVLDHAKLKMELIDEITKSLEIHDQNSSGSAEFWKGTSPMEQYRNLGGNSGVTAYEIGSDFIKVMFKDGSLYLYNYESTGQQDVETMKELATAGTGLNSFISSKVRKRYAAKLR